MDVIALWILTADNLQRPPKTCLLELLVHVFSPPPPFYSVYACVFLVNLAVNFYGMSGYSSVRVRVNHRTLSKRKQMTATNQAVLSCQESRESDQFPDSNFCLSS